MEGHPQIVVLADGKRSRERADVVGVGVAKRVGLAAEQGCGSRCGTTVNVESVLAAFDNIEQNAFEGVVTCELGGREAYAPVEVSAGTDVGGKGAVGAIGEGVTHGLRCAAALEDATDHKCVFPAVADGVQRRAPEQSVVVAAAVGQRGGVGHAYVVECNP